MTSKLCFKSTANCSAQPKSFNMEKFATALCLLVAVAGIEATDFDELLETGNSTIASSNTTVTELCNSIDSTLASVTSPGSTNMSNALTAAMNSSVAVLAFYMCTGTAEMGDGFMYLLNYCEYFVNNVTSADSDSADTATSCGTTYVTDGTSQYNAAITLISDVLQTLADLATSGAACTTNTCMSDVATEAVTNTAVAYEEAMDAANDLISFCDNTPSLMQNCTYSSD